MKSESVREHLGPVLVIVISVIIYNCTWDFIISTRIVSFNSQFGAAVYDLGIGYYRSWAVIHNFGTAVLISNITNSPIVLLLSPLSLIKNIFLLSFAQTLWISISVLPIYYISYKKLNSQWQSLVISFSFLLYFGIAGINWFDVHYQSLFIPLFLFGYAFLISGKNKTAALFIILSGLVRFPYEILPIMFSLSVLIQNLSEKEVSFKHNVVHISVVLISFVMLVPMLVVLYPLGINGAVNFLLAGAHSTTHGFLSNLLISLDDKIYTVFLLFGPFLMLPLFTKRWMFLLIPYMFLLFLSGTGFFYFPGFIQFQYWSLVIPFLFIGTIEGLEAITASHQKEIPSPPLSTERRAFRISARSKAVLAILIVIILLGTVYEPYGPLNKASATDFMLQSDLNYNASLFAAYNEIVNLIPANTPYVLYQDNMPEVVYHDPVSAPYFYGFGYSNNFTYKLGNNWTTHPGYIVADPYSHWFTNLGNGTTSLSMYDTLRHFLNTSGYGIAAEYDGLILLKYHYKGAPEIYSPENKVFTSSQLSPAKSYYSDNGTIRATDNTSNEMVWYGPYTFLEPGNYSLTLQLKSDNISSTNSFMLRFSYVNETGGSSYKVLRFFQISGSNLTQSNKWTNVSLNLSTGNFLNYVEFAGGNFKWSGNVTLRDITLTQTGYNR